MVASAWYFADRVELPLVAVPGLEANRTGVNAYAPRRWAAEWYAWLVVTEFSTTNWQGIVLPAVPSAADTDAEINTLVTAALNERPDSLGEIVSQADEFLSYFMALLAITPSSYPATCRVMAIASLTGLFAVMHFKGIANRPRPSHVCPALMPPIQVPGHASYPSGHATQAHLIAKCVQLVLPAADAMTAPLTADLDALAARIARNREIAGLHYPTDSAAGLVLATGIVPLLNSAAVPTFTTALTAAQGEWP
jgi:membrane-associated phospholipid phosphatase